MTILPDAPPPKSLIEELLPNADYGKGAGFRNITLVNEVDRVDVHLVDLLHEMKLTLFHDGQHVLDISAQFIRYPTNLCPGAVSSLSALKGKPIGQKAHQVGNGQMARQNCTHLFDLSALAIAHAGRSEKIRFYEARVPDLVDGQSTSTIACNGTLVHQWTHDGTIILAPGKYAGLPIKAGFFKWATQQLGDDELEAGSVLAKTTFISAGRQIHGPELKDIVLKRNVLAYGVCFAYQPERIDEGYFIGNNRRDTLDDALNG